MSDVEHLESTRAVIEVLGGRQAVMDLTGAASTNAVGNWERDNFFPAKAFVVMTEALRRIGKTAPARLWGQIEPERAA